MTEWKKEEKILIDFKDVTPEMMIGTKEEHPLYVMYTPDPGNSRSLLQRIRDMGFDVPDSQFISVGGAIGSHIGHNGCGIVYVEE